MGMTADDARRWVEEESKRRNVSAEEDDIRQLQEKNPEDVTGHQEALRRQYEQRGSNSAGSQSSSPWGESGGRGGGSDSLLERMWASYEQRENENRAREAERKERADSLYNTWQGRAQQSLQFNPDDPYIQQQVGHYRAEQDRSLRNAFSDAAEAGGQLGDTRKRMAAERVGQSVGGFQAELMSRELGTRRAEIADALASMGGMLTADQQFGLQRELANLDNSIRQYQLGQGDRELDVRKELGLEDLLLRRQLGFAQDDLGRRRLGLDQWDRMNYWDDQFGS